jgi:predicted ester cyclase
VCDAVTQGDKIAEEWVQFDDSGLMRQLTQP